MPSDDDEMVGSGPAIHRMAEAKTSEGRTIAVTWTTGERVTIDLRPLISKHRVFARLRVDDAFFRTMQLDELGHYIFWPDEPDCAIPAAYLEDYAVPA